ncbi:WxcM-like domain-containing protein [Flavobacterium sp. Root420]|uniref:WxcM-like domain-containing protein n=1 Tax=Flavobacterium sp. Root420 TaxID=1736533 RepID=UPI0006F74FD8|nr:WxcM-like domain-containing protein [Flavobacterium sp. Root420]KQW97679.1 sugar epimerase [Flavobacterium sp. Root420]
MEPKLISGNCHSDHRGLLFYNNEFNSSVVKRIYIIQNKSNDLIRGWQGHKIEQRWFSAICGQFKIQLIKIDDWENPSKSLEIKTFLIDSEKLNILHVPQGYISSIQSLESDSKLLVMADYLLSENKDEYRYDIDYFKI